MYIAIVSFIIWGFFNFFMIQYKDFISPINVILFLFVFAFIFMSIYRVISKESIVLIKKDKIVNFIAGMFQSFTYGIYFTLIFTYPSESIVIIVFYNLFGLITVLMDAIFFKTKNDHIEYFILGIVVTLSMFLIVKTQFILGNSFETISFTSLYGLLPAISAAIVGILYKYSSSYKSSSLKNLMTINMQFLFYRAFGGLMVAIVFYIIFGLSSEIYPKVSLLEIKLGFLYAIFPFLIGHFFYSISLYKKASMIVLSVFMNLSPIITISSMYYFSGIQYEFDDSILFTMVAIFTLSSILSIYHNKKHKKHKRQIEKELSKEIE